jgi:cytochrome c556
MKTALLFLLLMADDRAARKQRMDAIQDVKDDLKDALDVKSTAKAAEPAAKLVQFGEEEEDYWRKEKLDDIVKIAEQNLAAAREVAAAAKGGEFERAEQAFGRLELTCRSCHDAHPEKRLL